MQKRAHDGCRCNVANGRLQRCNDDRHGPFFPACLLDLYNSLEALVRPLPLCPMLQKYFDGFGAQRSLSGFGLKWFRPLKKFHRRPQKILLFH